MFFINYLEIEKCKPFEISWWIGDVFRETCFSPRNIYECLNFGLPQPAWIHKAVKEIETYWLSGKVIFLIAAVSKVGHTVC